MGSNTAPTRPRALDAFVDKLTGALSEYGLKMLESLWRQSAAGHQIVPVMIDQTIVNDLVLKPTMHEEGAESYGTGMAFWGMVELDVTGAVTASLARPKKTGNAYKVFINNGLAEAGAGDIIANGCYLFVYHEGLDGGAGGFVLK